jgi:hypothetical protein
MRRALLALVAVTTLVATPSIANHKADPVVLTDAARDELRGLEAMLRDVRDPYVRADMQERIDRIDGLLFETERALGADAAADRITFGEASRLVDQEAFDSGKLEVIRGLARNGRFTTDEARGLAAKCAFDSTRVDALVALYPSVTDKGRYRLALDILDFPSSRREVEEALGL